MSTGATSSEANPNGTSPPGKVEKVTFPSVTKDKIAGTLYYPAGETNTRLPCIVLGHGLGCIQSMGLQCYSHVFASAGYMCLSFDYRHFGDSEGQPRQLLDTEQQNKDWHSAIAYVRKLDVVDPERVGIFGSSFGGGHVIRVAAEDSKVKATIAQCPFTSGFRSALQLSPSSLPVTVAKGMADMLFGWGNFTVTVPLAAKPGHSALMNSPDAEDGYLNLVPEQDKDRLFYNKVAARFGIKILFQYPGAKAKDVKTPILFAVCGKDSVAPPGPTLKYAKQAKKGVVKHFEDMGHFSIYVGENFQKVTKIYLDFLSEALPVKEASARL